MDEKTLEGITKQIETKLGAESYAMISDNIGELITGNQKNLLSIAEREEQITKLKENNEKLVQANGALLQKIPVKSDDKKDEDKKEGNMISLTSAFDKTGRFIK